MKTNENSTRKTVGLGRLSAQEISELTWPAKATHLVIDTAGNEFAATRENATQLGGIWGWYTFARLIDGDPRTDTAVWQTIRRVSVHPLHQ
ncbi:MAG: hypothetical protein HS113_31005 [Verrucomicrobiales bacterium]|nr:hypothetical protein [Verrucomicrobiales bacterium]